MERPADYGREFVKYELLTTKYFNHAFYATYYGKSTSFSSRTYYGLRTLCEDCASSHNRGIIISGIIGRLIIVAILGYVIFRYKL